MASACSSSVSGQKSSAAQSTTSVSNNRCYLQKKKPKNPLAAPLQTAKKQDNVQQRLRSAKMVRIRALQSQLNDANFHLMELAQENRALKTTQRRQDKALKNYEGVNAELPRLIKSHEEENRVILEKNRTLKKQLRETQDLLKAREEELLALKDQMKFLTALARDKHLEERQQLRDSLSEAKELIKNYEGEITMLNRKLMLEVKNCKAKVNAEAYKYKKCQQELAHAIGEIDRTNESKGRLLRKRFESPTNQGRSLVSNSSKETIDSDIKLEPIKTRNTQSRNSITSPVENIKARLGSSSDVRTQKTEDINVILEKINMEEELLKKSVQGGLRNAKIKPTKLETLVQLSNKPIRNENHHINHQDDEPKEFIKKSTQDFIENERNYNLEGASNEKHEKDIHIEKISKVIDESTLQETEEIVRQHMKSLEASEQEYERVQQELKDIAEMEKLMESQTAEMNSNNHQLENNKVDTDHEIVKLKDEDYDLVNKLWDEEYAFRSIMEVKIHSEVNGTVQEEKTRKIPIVTLEKKKQLLATLRDIDNGKSIDKVETNCNGTDKNIDTQTKKSRLLKELFGS